MANKQLVIDIITNAKGFTSGLTEAINTINRAAKKAEGFETYTEELDKIKQDLSLVSQHTLQFEKQIQSGGTASQEQLESLASKIESIDKRFDSFRHTFKDMQDKLNGLSTRTLQAQLDNVNTSLDAFNQKYNSIQQMLSAGLGNNKNIEQISNIKEMREAYEDSLRVFKNFSKEMQFDENHNYSKAYIDAAAAVYKYSSAIMDLNDAYIAKGNKSIFLDDELEKIDDMAGKSAEIIGTDLADKLYDVVTSSIEKIDISNFFKQIEGQVDGQVLTGVLKNGGIIIPVKVDPKAYDELKANIRRYVDSLQTEIANNKPIKIKYDVDTKELTDKIEKYFNDLNTKIKNQVTELNTLMSKLVSDTGLKKTEEDFSSMAKLIPEMLRKTAEYSKQLESLTEETKNSFENLNSFVKDENFINYANAIRQTAESFKLLTSSLDDVSSKLSGNGLEGQFDLLKKKFSEISIDSVLNKENTKEIEAAKKAKIKEIKELFALYSTYQSRGGIRPFSDLISGETDANKKAYLQLAYNDYAKNKNKKGTGTESTPFDAQQLKDILQILKEIKGTIKSISEIKIDTSELAEAISKIQGNNNERIFTPQNVAQIWQVLIQYANNYSEALNQVIQNLEVISQKDFNSNNIQQSYEQIENIIQLLRKGFDISPPDQLNAYFDNIKSKYNSLLNDKGTLDLRKKKEELKDIYKLYYDYQKMGGEKDISLLTERTKDKQKLDVGYKNYLNIQTINDEELSKANNYNIILEKIVEELSFLRDKKIEPIDFNFEHLENYFSLLQNIANDLREVLNLYKQINNVPQKFDTGIEFSGDPKDSLKILTELEKRMPPVEEGFSRIVHITSSSNAQSVLDKGLSLPTSDLSQHSLYMKQYINDAQKMAQGLETTFNTLEILSGKFGDTAVIMDIPTEEVKGYSNAINGLDAVSTNYIRGTLNLSQSLITLNDNFGKSTTTIEAFAKAIYEAKQNEANLQSTNNAAPIIPAMSRSFQLINSANRIFGEEQFSQYYLQYETAQKEINDTKNISEVASQEIINAIDRVKNPLADIIGMLDNLNNELINISNNNTTIDYSNRISNIKRGITELNKSTQQLNEHFTHLDFDKINNIKISTEPFEKISDSLKEIINLIERVTGLASKTNLSSQFDYIQSLYNSMVNDKGNFIVKGNKGKMQLMYSLFDEYKNAGGQMSLHRLTDSHANQEKLYKYYDNYTGKVFKEKSELKADTTNLSDVFNTEINNYKNVEQAIIQTNSAKDAYIKKDKTIATQADKTIISIDKEKEALKNFTSELQTLTTINVEQNNVVQFNKDVSESVKEVIDGIKEEKELIQELSKIDFSSLQKSSSKFLDVKEERNKSSKNSSKNLPKNQSNVEEKIEENVNKILREQIDLNSGVLDTDPYLTAFNEFLLLAADEADKLKNQLITVAQFDQSLSDILTNLYAEIPDLEDISASTGYGNNFEINKATVSYRDKQTNDVYKKSFALKQDKDSGEFYIEQTTAILNDAEKYGKDNEKQAQKILEWQTKLNAWLQSFSNKTSGTLNSTSDYKSLENFNFTSEKDWIDVKTIQQRLTGLYNEIVSNSRKGSSSLSPVPNMVFGQESRLTKMEKANYMYNKMAIKWNDEDDSKGLKNTEQELITLSNLYKVLQTQMDIFDKHGDNIEAVSEAYGNFNNQLNKVNEQLNRIKIINTEINGNKINNLNQWFKDIPDPTKTNAADIGKIDKYTEVYNKFIETQNKLNGLTTNLTMGEDTLSKEEYKQKKEEIHNIVLELEQMKKVLSSDSMNLNNQMGQVIKQDLPKIDDIKELDNIINEYAKAKGVIQNLSSTGLITDKEGNQFAKFTREVKDAKGVVTEFEFTYDKAMGTVAVATKKVQEPESLLKTITDELNTKWRGLFTTLLSFTGFYRLWGYFKQGVSTIKEFDDALTEMQKVSDNTIQTLQEYQKTTFDTADAIGATALQIQNSTADFMRLGETLNKAAESAKVANVLMNVSEFQSIDEATKSLIAMSAAYDDLSKMNIIDKLNEVGNNYAISTSEAATALQNSASALKTAGNDMDEALALITAGNAVVQDANKVGTGMRTIALRLTGTKSAKEQLEELGEETENVITTQSKLRDVIKEATAVASNGYQGFDILDDNGNYKSTYEIMLGIAEVYDEILETDKQFGRNNANLLLENVAGKTRANIAASIFQNPQLLKDAYKSSQEAENSAMEENEKYLNSISGHMAQLQNAYQEVWANSMNRDTINFFVDLGKNILNVVDDIGLLGTAFTTIVGVRSIVGFQNNKGFAVIIAKWVKDSLKSLATMEGGIGSVTTSVIGLGKSFTSNFASAIPVIGGVATAIGLVGVAVYGAIRHYEKLKQEAINTATDMGKEWQQQKQSLSEYASQYEELKNKLKSGNLSEQETIDTKQKIYDIQKSITEEYGKNVGNIDLINGELREQLNIINNISQAEANRIWNSDKYQKGFELAKEAMITENEYSLSRIFDDNYQPKTSEDKELFNIIEKYTQKKKYDKESQSMGFYRAIVGNPIEADNQIMKMIEEIEELQKDNKNNEDFQKQTDNILSFLNRYRDQINEIRKENEKTYLEGLPIELMATRGKENYKIYTNYQSSTSDLESAYASGNTKKIEEARKAFDEANKAKDNFLKIEGNEQFSLLFDSITSSIVETKNKAYDAVQNLKIASQINEEILSYEEKAKSDKSAQNYLKYLKDETKSTGKYTKENKKLAKALKEVTNLNMDRVDAELIFDKNATGSEIYSNALRNLMDAMGWTIDDANLLIDTLVEAGYIQGSLVDAVDNASISYNEYANAISTATENLSTLQNVLTESDSGKGLTNTTLDQFKQAFGDDAVKALENTANGIRVNRDAIRELGEQQNESLRTTHLEALNAQYTALQKVYEGYENALKNGDPTTPFIQQEQTIKDEIANLELLEAQWRGTSSAYQAWINAQSNSNPQDMYANIVSGYETVEDLIARGWWSDESVRTYLDFVLEDDWDAQAAGANELKKKFESLDKTIKGTSFSIHDFFMTDEKGNLVVDGLNNFEDALKQIQDKYYPDKNWLSYDEDGNAIFDFTNGGNKEVADALGIGTEFLDALIAAMESAGGFEIKLDTDDANKSLDELKQTAVEAKDSLNLNEKINLDPTSVEEADKSINNLSQVITSLQDDNTIDLETKTDKLEKANKILEYLVENKNQLVQKQFTNGEIHLIDVDELEAADKKIEKIMNRPIKDGFDFSNFDLDSIEGLESAKNTISSMINNMSLSPDVDDSKVQYLNELLDAIQAKIDIINGAGTNGAELTLGEYKAIDETVTSIKQQIEEGQAAVQKGFHISWSSDKEFFDTLNTLNNLDPEIKAAFGLIPDKTTEELIDMVENGETIFIETKTKGAVPTPVQDETRTINTQENVTLGVTTVGADVAEEAIRRIEEKNGTESTIVLNAESNVEEVQQGLQETQEESKQLDAERPDVTATLDDKATSPLNSLRNLITDTDGMSATVFSYYKDPDNAHYEISYIDSHVHDRTQTITTEYKTIGSPSGMGGVNGTAHVFGTAFAKGSINAYNNGDWGVSEDQTALVGELGTELLVRNGKWYDIGDQGAEFVNLKKGDIIFNSRQRDELFANGYVTSNGGRGRMIGGSSFAMGSIVSGGNAFADEAKRTRTTSSVKTKKAGSKNSTTSKGNGGSNGGGNGNHGGGNSSKVKEETKKTKNTLDEVEILIARIERQISRLDNTIGNTYIKWATRNQAVTRDLKKVSKEIVKQRKAYDTYMTKANSIGLPEEWAKKVREGKQAIEDVVEQAKESGDNADSLWDKITKYREYYEKALAALDKVQELEQKEGELYKTRFDHEQTYYEEMIDNLQHTVDIMGAYNDQLEESGKLNSRNLIIKQMSVERAKLQKLEDEYKILVNRQNEAVKSGKIKKYSEAWYEMQQAINDVRDAIVEANTNLISFDNAFREVNWNRWDKVHDAISGVTNELEFLYDLIDEDKMFDDTGTITNEGLAAFGLLAQEYDTYFAEVERYQKEIDVTKKELADDPYNQNLVDKLKEQIEAQQDAVNGAKKTKEAMLDVAENGVKKQIDYIKKLIDDYEELMDAQKDQSDYAKKVADQQKEINKLEKQYRAIQNDTSEEGATKRQQLREQLKEKRQDLADTQEDRRISETKDMLAKFQETFEDFLENKLKDVEGIIKEGIAGVNNNTEIIKDTIESVADSYGYTLSDTLQTTLSGLSNNLASYFDSAFDNRNVKSIADGVDAIVSYYNKAQVESNRIAMADKVKETGTHIQAYVDEKGKTHVGYFDNNGNQKTDYTGQARSGDKIYRFENGQKVTKGNRWVNEGGSKYYLNKNGTYATGITSINGKKYYFDSTGKMKTAWQTINGNKYHFNKQGVMHTGLVTIGKNKYYFDKNGVLQMGKWQTINGKRYYLSATDGHVLTGKQKINGEEYTFYNDGVLKGKGWKKGTSSVPKSGYAWTNEGFKAEAIIRKSDGAILTPLNRGDSVIPSNAMKNMYQALTNPEKYLKQYTTPDVRVVQANNGKGSSTPATINMQFIANGVQDANKFANDLMNNKKLESWIQEITLGRANGNNSFKKYSYAIR